MNITSSHIIKAPLGVFFCFMITLKVKFLAFFLLYIHKSRVDKNIAHPVVFYDNLGLTVRFLAFSLHILIDLVQCPIHRICVVVQFSLILYVLESRLYSSWHGCVRHNNNNQ